MSKIAAAVMVAAMLIGPGIAAADTGASRTNDPIATGMHDKRDEKGAGSGANGQAYGHRQDGRHRPRVVAILVYVPEIRPVNAPYYYAPDTPVYIDQDPPDGAYREVNGFYYWCNSPAGYYPLQPDCPTGWRLVAQ
jgi:hypothetical protein